MGSFSVFHWIILGVVVWGIYQLVRGAKGSGETVFCTTCGNQGKGASTTRGSILIELILWCCFILPGLIYSLWRLTTRAAVCSKCGAATIVPADSPVAQKMRKELQSL